MVNANDVITGATLRSKLLKRGDIRISDNDVFITDYDSNEYSIFDYYLIDKKEFSDISSMLIVANDLINIEQNILRLNNSNNKTKNPSSNNNKTKIISSNIKTNIEDINEFAEFLEEDEYEYAD